ncbi:polysaccharide biosynthesis/export family protein [bacterium]|nr:polysaccharide biosynthesis/export family protein [bacterium]
MNTAKPKKLEKRRPRTDLVWPSLLLSILVFSGCQSSPSRTSNDGLQPGETIWVCDAQHDVKTEQIEARILADGTVTLPYIGAIRLAGLTISEAERTVEDAYRVSGLYKHLQIRILREQRPTKEGNAGNGHYDAGDKAHR